MLIILNKSIICEVPDTASYNEIVKLVAEQTKLACDDFYLEQNGKRYNADMNCAMQPGTVNAVQCILRHFGGKGGFGSMLRAIGAQIEKTTNKEACRDLSGRRLRDINEEKRLKAWLEKQGERERAIEQRKKQKIDKLLSVPKHDFVDDEYEQSRSMVLEKVSGAVDEGFEKAEKIRKRHACDTTVSKEHPKIKKKKKGFWLDNTTDSSDDSEEEVETSK